MTSPHFIAEKFLQLDNLTDMTKYFEEVIAKESEINIYYIIGLAITSSEKKSQDLIISLFDKEHDATAIGQEIAYNTKQSLTYNNRNIVNKLELFFDSGFSFSFKLAAIMWAFIMLDKNVNAENILFKQLYTFPKSTEIN